MTLIFRKKYFILLLCIARLFFILLFARSKVLKCEIHCVKCYFEMHVPVLNLKVQETFSKQEEECTFPVTIRAKLSVSNL